MPRTQAAHSHTLSYDELQAAYVRAQFASEDYYSDPDIRMWLRQEQNADRPDLSRWDEYVPIRNLKRFCRGRAMQFLLTTGAPHQFDDRSKNKWDGERDPSYVLCSALDPYKVQIYKSADSQAIVYFKRAPKPFAVTVTSRGAIRREIDVGDVFNIFIDTWTDGGKFAKNAQDFVCEALQHDVDEATLKLEDVFDRSVAATSDGMSIVPADRVVFYSRTLHRGAYHVYMPEPFQADKLLLGSIIERAEVSVILSQLVHPKQPVVLDGIIKKLMADDPRQLIIRTRDGRSVFFCHHNLAPDPLPDGADVRPAPK